MDLKQMADNAFKESETPAPEAPKEEPKVELPKVEPEEPIEPEEEIEEIEVDEPEESKKVELPPANQYVYDKLPTLSVRGKLANGQTKEYKFKIPEELPDDFEFASGKEAALYNAKVADQANTAKDLFTKYQQEQQEAQFKEFQVREEREVLQDMIGLQNSGKLPKFKYKESDSRFNDDEAVKYVNKILKYRDELNSSYSSAGKLYRVPFDVAARMYTAETPYSKPEPEKTEQQKKETAERKKVATKITGNDGTTARTGAISTRYRPGMSLKQIADNEARLAGLV